MENKSFRFYLPTKVIFGAGRLSALKKISLPGKRALIVTTSGGSMKKFGYLDRVQKLLGERSIESVLYDKIVSNPIVEHVTEGALKAKEHKCDFVIGLGGGSAIDSAKSIALMATNEGHYWDYMFGGSGGRKTIQASALPIVAIPTTAGTGTEVDPWIVITNGDQKIGWGDDSTFPRLAIVDPELMLSIPARQSAFQGMDAFFHLVEGYIAKVNQPLSDGIALEGIKALVRYLPRVIDSENDLAARTEVAWASTQAGLVETLSSCISHHSLEHGLSGIYPEIPHGAGLVMLSKAYFGLLQERGVERLSFLAQVMGRSDGNFKEALSQLIDTIGLAKIRPGDFGVTVTNFNQIVGNAFDTMGGLFKLDPSPLNSNDLLGILERSFCQQ